MIQTITIDDNDATMLTELAASYPGVTLHLTHLAVLRLGLRQATDDRALLAAELAAIGQARRERRRRPRKAARRLLEGTSSKKGGSNE